MNNRVAGAYAAILNNQIVCIDFNIADFREAFIKFEPHLNRDYQYYYRLFAKEQPFSMEIDGKLYFFQSIIYKPHAKHKPRKAKS
jgi:hypothetical protein